MFDTPLEQIAEDGAGFAGFAAWLDMDPTMGDLLAVPDPTTLTPLPWRPEVGWLSCNLVHEGAELAHGPRNVLRNVQANLADAGFTLKSGVECEFFLIDGAALPTGATSAALSDPYDIQTKPCYDAHALMRKYDLISQLCEHMEALGWGPYQADHEDANGQFEINWDVRGLTPPTSGASHPCSPPLAFLACSPRGGRSRPCPAQFNDVLVTADRVTFFKYMARTLAEQAGLRATFMPKPFANLTGSGCHAHLSLHDVTTGKNLCGGGGSDVHGLSPLALNFLAGVLDNAPAITALTNPTVNSYKRLGARTTSSGATWSPTAATWAGNNRTALVRIQGSHGRPAPCCLVHSSHCVRCVRSVCVLCALCVRSATGSRPWRCAANGVAPCGYERQPVLNGRRHWRRWPRWRARGRAGAATRRLEHVQCARPRRRRRESIEQGPPDDAA